MELMPNLHAFIWSSPTVNNCNTYLIRSAQKLILVDPGHVHLFDHVRRGLDALKIDLNQIDMVVCTHAHPDHLEAAQLFKPTPALLALHTAEWDLVQKVAPDLNINPEPFIPDFFLEEGELRVGDVVLHVYHTPGHSPGAVTLHWPTGNALFTGDLVFKDGVGRTDLPGGNEKQLKDSIHRMAALETNWLLSGHGEVIAGNDAVKANFDQVARMWLGHI
ncbi:MAG: MBL fold metallo-hydrolase [Desulfatitalea sp.]|nr:MBL fold metallo-hydrolase [Desulfatitalea sp.]NNJ99397.1 MBL fold metallo-hydrolase [Desulfatitalea sp.]